MKTFAVKQGWESGIYCLETRVYENWEIYGGTNCTGINYLETRVYENGGLRGAWLGVEYKLPRNKSV